MLPKNFAPFASRSLVPFTYGDRVIKWRSPYEMSEDIDVDASSNATFPEDAFKHALSKPFEVWRVRFTVLGLDDSDPAAIYEPQPTTLDHRVTVYMKALSRDFEMMKAATPVNELMDDASRWWEWNVPDTIESSQGYSVDVAVGVLPTFCLNDPAAQTPCDPTAKVVSAVRVRATFEGFLLTLAPADQQ